MARFRQTRRGLLLQSAAVSTAFSFMKIGITPSWSATAANIPFRLRGHPSGNNPVSKMSSGGAASLDHPDQRASFHWIALDFFDESGGKLSIPQDELDFEVSCYYFHADQGSGSWSDWASKGEIVPPGGDGASSAICAFRVRMVGKRKDEFTVSYDAGMSLHRVQDGFPKNQSDQPNGTQSASDGDPCGEQRAFYHQIESGHSFAYFPRIHSFTVRLSTK